ncbi:hypothetical protein BDN71DRAFT_1444442 [Pleurotus eryngii]|uniref:Uncharacterized protein n=1 Tax=Pleurotus eryngii TaxID=5323 RepID=A0A9P6A5L2_PLEER|nr:hypothetical protein BDN71DRAFT_1444442 [Pleurotus eryngii]
MGERQMFAVGDIVLLTFSCNSYLLPPDTLLPTRQKLPPNTRTSSFPDRLMYSSTETLPATPNIMELVSITFIPRK